MRASMNIQFLAALWLMLFATYKAQFTTFTVKSPVTLDRVNPCAQGACIAPGDGSATLSDNGNGWTVDSTGWDEVGWSLVTTLDTTWGFHARFPSTITVDLNTNNPSVESIMIGFQVPGSGVFSAYRLRDDDSIRYSTDSCSATGTTSQDSGDLDSIVVGNIICDLGVSGGGCNKPYTQLSTQAVPSPIKFVIRNEPGQGAFFEYVGSDTCGVAELNTESGFKIYFGLRPAGTINFDGITISYSYELTLAPTADPTNSPITTTASPTSPTSPTTADPTLHPTGATLNPSVSPTNVPTESPTETTNAPSSQTNNPTKSPTNVPTAPPSNNPSQSPTPSPTDPQPEATVIDSATATWLDDYVTYPAEAAGWITEQDGNPANGITGNYHGVFGGPATTGGFTLFDTYRWFKCPFTSTLSISYQYIYCGVDDSASTGPDWFDFMFNDTSTNLLDIDSASTSDSCLGSTQPDGSSCAATYNGARCSGTSDPWFTRNEVLTDFATVANNEQFKIGFSMRLSYFEDVMAFTDVQITCNQIITPSPTGHPVSGPTTPPTTAFPSASPSSHPSVSPTRSPTDVPTNYPSVPPGSPSSSPTLRPTDTSTAPTSTPTTTEPSAAPTTEDDQGVVDNTPSPTPDENNEGDDNQQATVTGEMGYNLMLIIGGAGVCILCGAIIGIYFCCKKRKEGKGMVDDNDNDTAAVASPASTNQSAAKSNTNGRGYMAAAGASPRSTSSPNGYGNASPFNGHSSQYSENDGAPTTMPTAQILQMSNIAAEQQDEEQGMKNLATSMKAEEDFGMNLSSLAGANNMLLDDVVDDMEFHDDVDDIENAADGDSDDEVLAPAGGGTAGGPTAGGPTVTAGGPSVADLNLDEEDDGGETYQDQGGEDLDEEDDNAVIGGMQTLR